MTHIDKLYSRLLTNPALRISFIDLEGLHISFGFKMRQGKGSHRHYKHPDVPFILTVQPRGKDALPYQVKRLLEVVRDYGLHMRT